jgi:hypothetical protein
MKSFTAAFVLALFATSAVGRNCTPGLNYCGHTLLDIGNTNPYECLPL